MEQYKIVEAVSEKIISEEKCEAIYLLGKSPARSTTSFRTWICWFWLL